jgi:hypothetical protein
MSGDFNFSFFVLTGDANHDGTVNGLDFNALANNYGQPGNFTQGDFDYSGTIGSNDFALLAGRYGATLGAVSSSSSDSQLPSADPPAMNTTPSNLFGNEPIGNDNSLLQDFEPVGSAGFF